MRTGSVQMGRGERMSRLIDADDVKKRGDCYPPEVRSVISNILRHTKTIKDVAPVKHGHWIDGHVKHIENGEIRNMRECSECGACYFVYDAYNSSEQTPNYCPACGCKMDEVSE